MGKTDKKRYELKGPLGVNALLVQCRGDWAMYRELFRFPSWSSAAVCWKCEANRTDKDFKDFSLTAALRKHRTSAEVFFHRQSQEGISRSSLFDCPGFRLHMVCIDILHVLDLGVSQKLLGNILFEGIKTICAGRSYREKTKDMWAKVQAHV